MTDATLPPALREALDADDPNGLPRAMDPGKWPPDRVLRADRARAMAAALRWAWWGNGMATDAAVKDAIATLEREAER